MANGDARVALNALETAVFATAPDDQGRRTIDLDTISDALQRRSPIYDKAGEGHYDTISAFIKSVRGASPDGALYWLARMIEAGEDPLFIARRLVILAAEDIGLAQPEALAGGGGGPAGGALSGDARGPHPLGRGHRLPRHRLPRATRPTWPSSRPLTMFVNGKTSRCPCTCGNAVTGLMRESGYGKDYRYAHNYPGHFVEQAFLPPSLKDRRYYKPTQEGSEKEIEASGLEEVVGDVGGAACRVPTWTI